jgi:hypothetical protein
MVTLPGFAEIWKLGLPTTKVAVPEVELTKLASPEYCAVMLFEPFVS